MKNKHEASENRKEDTDQCHFIGEVIYIQTLLLNATLYLTKPSYLTKCTDEDEK